MCWGITKQGQISFSGWAMSPSDNGEYSKVKK
jgi:hypothetical protein